MAMRIAAALAGIALLIAAAPADARGGVFPHGGYSQGFSKGGRSLYGGRGWQGAGANGAGAFTRDQNHAEDPYVKAATEEEERLLKQLNSICRGC